MFEGAGAQEGAEFLRGLILERATRCSAGSGCSRGPCANQERVPKRRTGF